MREIVKLFIFITVSWLFVGVFFTSVDFITAPAHTSKDFLILFAQWFFVCIASWFLIYLLAIYKYVFAICFPILTLLSGILSFFRYTLGAMLTPALLDATLDSNRATRSDLISLELILFLLICLSISVLLVFYRFKYVRIRKPLIHLGVSAILLFAFFQLPRAKMPTSNRIPFNIFFVSRTYFLNKAQLRQDRISMSDKISCDEVGDSLIVCLVIGESLRADHMSINNYERQTNPYLENEDIISFPNIYTPYTHTNACVPYMLSRSDSIHPNRMFEERSFIDLFRKCGFYSSWSANQNANSNFLYFINECDTISNVNIEKGSYVFDKWVDADLFPVFDMFMQKSHPRKLIILHTIGSHWYYNSHYTDEFQKFTPITKSRIVSSSTREELINSYDNTILYTDYFIYSIIERLREKNAFLIYISDHGESLGENGFWLHAADSPPIHNPACFVWMSPSYKMKYPDTYERFTDNRMKAFWSDFLFHTITLAAGIKGEIIREDLSFFRNSE